EPLQGARRHDFGRILVVILAVHIDVQHHFAAIEQAGAQEPALRQIREAEEWRRMLTRKCQSARHGQLAPRHFRHRLFMGQLGQITVVIGVAAHRVPSLGHSRRQTRIGFRRSAQHQERRLDAKGVERLEDRGSAASARTVIKRQDDFARLQNNVCGRRYRQGPSAKLTTHDNPLRFGQRGLGCRHRHGHWQDLGSERWAFGLIGT
uniref:Nitrite reductase n=1 Tax=Parastrongyloides trichosuri TaxID=131310 RepID=A0A0N4ZGW8_PARTI